MEYLIGTDEAGYGPNLGPLVISATVWHAPDGVGVAGLFDRLHAVVASDRRQPGVWMGDSKQLYAAGKGLQHLERGLWAALGLLNACPKTWPTLWQTFAPEALDAMASIPWYRDYHEPLPIDQPADQLPSTIETLRHGVDQAGVRLMSMQSRVIFEPEFNRLVERSESKGAALSHETLRLIVRAIDALPPSRVSVVCDKHGGRNRYAPLLAEYFPDHLIEIHGESRERSVYRFGPPDRRREFCFRAKAEACLPVALASMASKYLREAAMRALNDFWRRRVPGLQPTAGYPEDAKRFRQEVLEAKRHLPIEDRDWWRIK
ncbi:MAG: hypothetical protein LLF97_02755 [Planctomycetaceae bacterium]|nr:hypothetical protein [Planctomycetaceae bacterium]